MSNKLCMELWSEVQDHLDDIVSKEVAAAGAKPEHNKALALEGLLGLYLRHLRLLSGLARCYDQTVHPQKRLVLRRSLDAVMGRLVELKLELANLELMEFHFFDDLQVDFKLLPHDAEMPIAPYFRLERKDTLAGVNEIIGDALRKLGAIQSEAKVSSQMSRDEAVRLIQRQERARQGRHRARFMQEIHRQEMKEKTKGKYVPSMSDDAAALRIQTVWRGFAARRNVKRMREEEMIFIGMLPPRRPSPPPERRVAEVEASRRELQARHQQQYEEALVTVKEELRRLEAVQMREDMQDDIRAWMMAEWQKSGAFPDLPNEEEGGSAALFDPDFVPPPKPEKEDKKGKGKKGKKDKKDKKDEKKKKKKKGEEDEGFIMQPSKFVPVIMEACMEYDEKWKHKEEKSNFEQNFDADIVRRDKRRELELEVRRDVDTAMREELDRLKDALERDKGKKGRKKKKGKKKRRGGKKGKKKKGKDLTPDRSLESLVEELVENNVMKLIPEKRMSEFIGYPQLTGSLQRLKSQEARPLLGDVRRVLTEYCIIPLGCASVHETAPLIKSVLIAGPPGCGRKHLVHAICAESGAVLFDLSASNIAGRYPGKVGLTMLMHLVNKVGRLLQPSVIWIDNAEKTFVKKVPKTDKTEPKRLKKELPKLLKALTPADRLLLVGTSETPWEADQKALGQTYSRVILMPPLDYASRLQLLSRAVAVPGVPRHPALDLSTLTKLTDGFTAGHCLDMVHEVVTEKRIVKLRKRPLKTTEFVPVLANLQPVMREQQEMYYTWLTKTPLGKKRAKMLEAEAEEANKASAGKKKK
ncbi:dynein regulatory complex protein 11-like [Amphibalanus amphitrite]|uniref:dynein regulatory complex protein 11-like n=1 Tax=Amphibalanus amphitrite TaxID=1232801 RepID=UPI001C90EFB6|nr:dynein regulatory complex protein 11-like [Amphibalanus amphitrite]XP_043208793.1 dynein regulatory complex protein 11-like [Amphibalanus amphitrite]